MENNKRVAVVGGGISGLMAAFELAKAGVNVVLYEKEDLLGGHAKTVNVHGVDLDLGFTVFNRVSYPHMMDLFENLGIEMEPVDMSFSVSLDKGQGCEWGTRHGLKSLFAQKSNALKPSYWRMIKEIMKFNEEMIRYLEELENNPDLDRSETLGHYMNSRGYSELFQNAYLVPICASVWSCASDVVMGFSVFSVLSCCRNHHALQVFGRPQWLTVKGRSQCYVEKVREELEARGVQIKTSCEVYSISTNNQGCTLSFGDSSQKTYDRCIVALHAPDAIQKLGEEATHDERRILGAFQYVDCDIYLHHDTSFMPQNQAAWGSWNFLGSNDSKVCVTYWLNLLQDIEDTKLQYFETLNPPSQPQNVLLKWTTCHPVPSVAATKASLEIQKIQGTRGIWFCGAYQGYGFHEDGIKAGKIAAHGLLGETFSILPYPKQMVPSLTEGAARLSVTKFLGRFVSAGKLIFLEDGGSILTFEGSQKLCPLTVSVRIHNPQFYWKVATEADLGFADAYIQGDISFVDKDDGILNVIKLFIANKYLLPSASGVKYGDLWTSLFSFTTSVASMKFIYHQFIRRNTISQARRNISDHYDLSNKMFSLFLDETMTYSSAIFKSENEDLKIAQERKISLLVEKARVQKHHEVLEIGCGWGSIALEVVKRTGCRYTGITISEEQLKFAEERVKKAGLADRMRFLLCDYRQLQDVHKYDRIISCEMLEAVGHEFMEDFFRCCDTLLATDGLLVLQTVSVPDRCYDEFRKVPGFIKEYIFPGGCLPSLSRITSAMSAASTLNVEHLENIGVHYGKTLRCWKKSFLENQSKIISLGFNEKFVRMWEYYFEYCAAGFLMRLIGDYQMVFSRQVNLTAFSDPYETIPSAHLFP